MSEQDVFDALKYHIEVDSLGNRFYYNSANQLHRENGPAIEYDDGTKCWYQSNQRHRTDGPAVVGSNGYKEWCQGDLRHRVDGPAIEWPSGAKAWYINGKALTETEFNQRVKSL